jgi:glycosyltransferase involved in cell wall biosynthesis
MTEVTILVPTFRHPPLLPYAVRSALAQTDVSFELFIVGDGVEDDTRAAIAPFLADSRVRFFDFPKGARHGEKNRDDALREAQGEIICYLSDDDLLLPGFLRELRVLLEHADFAHSAPVSVHPDGLLEYRPADLARPEFLALIRNGQNNFISLTGAGHSRAAYDRLPTGWNPAPPGTNTDIHMWQRFAEQPWFRGATGERLTALHFPDPEWRAVDPAEREAALASWLDAAAKPRAEETFDRLLSRAIRVAAQDFKLRTIELRHSLETATSEAEALRSRLLRRAARRLARGVGRSRQR